MRVSQKPPLPREGEGWGEGIRDKALILITLILAFSLEGRRDKTFYDTL